MFECSIVKSLVTPRVMQPQEYLAAELWLEIYSDGVTPSSENVSVHMAKVIDPFRLVWKNGYSPSFRIAKHPGAEGNILSLDPWIVRALSLFVSRGHMVHPSLVMFFVIKFLGGDNKSLGLCMGRSQNGCPSCFLFRHEFSHPLQPGAVERFMPASVLDKAVSYLRALFEVAAWIVTRPPSFRIHRGRVNALFDRLKSQRGVIRFPLFVEGNALADCQMLNVLEDWLSLSGTPLVVGAVCDGPSSAVLDLYCDLRELDVLLGACAPGVSGRIFLPSPKTFMDTRGFPLHTITVVQALLHNLMHWFKSIAIDNLSELSAAVKKDLQNEARLDSLKSERMNYTRTCHMFRNESGQAFSHLSGLALTLAQMCQQIILQGTCVEDTSRLAQVRYFFDVFLLDAVNGLVATQRKQTKKREGPNLTGPLLKKAKTAETPDVHDMTFRTSHYKHGSQAQALCFVYHGLMLEAAATSTFPVEGKSIPPSYTSEVPLEAEMAKDKAVHKGRAPKSLDGGYILRAEAILEKRRRAQIEYGIGVSSDRLEAETPKSALIEQRQYHHSFVQHPVIKPVFEGCRQFFQGLGPKFSQYIYFCPQSQVWQIASPASSSSSSSSPTRAPVASVLTCSMSSGSLSRATPSMPIISSMTSGPQLSASVAVLTCSMSSVSTCSVTSTSTSAFTSTSTPTFAPSFSSSMSSSSSSTVPSLPRDPVASVPGAESSVEVDVDLTA